MVIECDIRTFARKYLAYCCPDASGPARNERTLSFKQ